MPVLEKELDLRHIYDSHQASSLLGISRTTLWAWSRSGKIAAFKIAGSKGYRYFLCDLQDFLSKCRVHKQAEAPPDRPRFGRVEALFPESK